MLRPSPRRTQSHKGAPGGDSPSRHDHFVPSHVPRTKSSSSLMRLVRTSSPSLLIKPSPTTGSIFPGETTETSSPSRLGRILASNSTTSTTTLEALTSSRSSGIRRFRDSRSSPHKAKNDSTDFGTSAVPQGRSPSFGGRIRSTITSLAITHKPSTGTETDLPSPPSSMYAMEDDPFRYSPRLPQVLLPATQPRTPVMRSSSKPERQSNLSGTRSRNNSVPNIKAQIPSSGSPARLPSTDKRHRKDAKPSPHHIRLDRTVNAPSSRPMPTSPLSLRTTRSLATVEDHSIVKVRSVTAPLRIQHHAKNPSSGAIGLSLFDLSTNKAATVVSSNISGPVEKNVLQGSDPISKEDDSDSRSITSSSSGTSSVGSVLPLSESRLSLLGRGLNPWSILGLESMERSLGICDDTSAASADRGRFEGATQISLSDIKDPRGLPIDGFDHHALLSSESFTVVEAGTRMLFEDSSSTIADMLPGRATASLTGVIDQQPHNLGDGSHEPVSAATDFPIDPPPSPSKDPKKRRGFIYRSSVMDPPFVHRSPSPEAGTNATPETPLQSSGVPGSDRNSNGSGEVWASASDHSLNEVLWA